MDEKLTYSVEEAGRALGVSRNTAYAAARSGEIPVVRFGGRLLVPRRALERMLEERASNASREVAAAVR